MKILNDKKVICLIDCLLAGHEIVVSLRFDVVMDMMKFGSSFFFR